MDGTGVYPSLREPVYATEDDIEGQFNTITYGKVNRFRSTVIEVFYMTVSNNGITDK